MSYTEQMQELVDKYRAANQPWPATAKDLAKWAFGNGLWNPHPLALISQCADDFAKAMREEYITDPQGRPVRAKHAARIEIGPGPPSKSYRQKLQFASCSFASVPQRHVWRSPAAAPQLASTLGLCHLSGRLDVPW